MQSNSEKPKIGAGTLSASMRLGLTELRNAVFADSNVAARHTETGMYGTATQYEVNQERQGQTPEMSSEHHSVLEDKLRQAEQAREGREPPSKELERG